MIERQASVYFGPNFVVLVGVSYDVYRDPDSLYLAYIEHGFLDFSVFFFVFYLVTQFKSLRKQNKDFLNHAKFDLSERHHTVHNTKIARRLIPFTIILLIFCYLNEVLVFAMIFINENVELLTIINLLWLVVLSNRCLYVPIGIIYVGLCFFIPKKTN
uniref:CPBP family intramembrane metalloprotease n=1 Tax=Strongyloides papillosus TaxID=174720 RepID=A0A0N5BZ88_STREA